MGRRRRSAASSSRARVSFFSFSSKASRAARHWAPETILGSAEAGLATLGFTAAALATGLVEALGEVFRVLDAIAEVLLTLKTHNRPTFRQLVRNFRQPGHTPGVKIMHTTTKAQPWRKIAMCSLSARVPRDSYSPCGSRDWAWLYESSIKPPNQAPPPGRLPSRHGHWN